MPEEKKLEQEFRKLGLEPGASLEEVDRACRELSSTWNPDRMPDVAGLKESARKKLEEIEAARNSIRAWHARAAGKGIERANLTSSLYEEIFAPGGRKKGRGTVWLAGLAGVALLVVLVLVFPGRPERPPEPTDPVPAPAAQAESQQAAPDFKPGQPLKAIKVVTPPEAPPQAEPPKTDPEPGSTRPQTPKRPKPRLVRPPQDQRTPH